MKNSCVWNVSFGVPQVFSVRHHSKTMKNWLPFLSTKDTTVKKILPTTLIQFQSVYFIIDSSLVQNYTLWLPFKLKGKYDQKT